MLNPEYKNQNPNSWQGNNWNEESRTKAKEINFEIKRGLIGVPSIDKSNKLNRKINADPLTGVMNRAYFESFKKSRFNPETDHNKIGLIFIDLNGLKKINDQYTHRIGDQTIKNIIGYLESKFRDGDEICRIGGDEFVIICHNNNNDENFEENLKKKIVKIMAEKPKNKDERTEISFAYGVAVYEKKDGNLENTKDRADKLMYKHKKEMKRNLLV
ncbi:MAG: Diguanylate cyclase [Candidatus Pacebacteria bacterium GW2011_GWF2_38_9]|nr:MAG: diguanylate cyclase [candidate division TM6 bacterium GW2011_GWF2_28_16]KKQ07549.1 MAG: Diguanylate cyclase [Candidatus Pacebacteria bacterium GW2011_GWF1_36_5]KKQ88600.1 MAG: Diguanylate cyclase [Candidatus Pacebacteria bacterium GW2011_GWF2_38_9]HAZ73492.1 hypothetical protein [Candidatus Paceibacterota bacterium]